MIRSHLFFTLIFLAYLGMTPVGVYTCACFLPAQVELIQIDLDDIAERQPSSLDTAVVTLLSYFSMVYMVAAAFLLIARRPRYDRYALFWLEPDQFCEPPPTPPPHLA